MTERRSWHRTSRHARGYGTLWDKLRKVILARDSYLCQSCLPDRATRASHVDHIKPKAKGGTDDLSNLQSLCAECEREKSIRDSGGTPKVRRRIALDGWPIDD